MSAPATIYPALVYRDPVAALAWLERAFGFRVVADYRNPDGTVAHAEMAYGPSVLMIGSVKPEMGWLTPADAGGCTQMLYLAIDDPDAHHDRARAAGAEITRAPNDTSYGSREYAARDCEGHSWSFGTYRPSA